MRKITARGKFLAIYLFACMAAPHAAAQEAEPQERRAAPEFMQPLLRAQQQEYNDIMNLRKDRELAATRSAAQNSLIAATESQLKESAAKIEASSEETTKEAEKLVEKIEKFKKALQKFNESYDSSSPEVISLRDSIEDEYAQLERGEYNATSLSSAIILRGDSYDEESGTWSIRIHTNFLHAYTQLSAQPLRISYQELCGKKNTNSKEDAENIMLYDSLFRRAAPVIYAHISYRILRWKDASEYALIPLSAELIRTDTGTIIKRIPAERLPPQTVSMYPRRETRNELEKNADARRAELIRTQGISALTRTEPESKGKKGSYFFAAEQRGRRALYFTADIGLFNSQLADFDHKALSLHSVKGALAVGLKDYFFVGGSFGFDYLGSLKNAEYSFGANGGANIMLGQYVRPYAEAGLEFHTNLIGVASVGSGIDIIFGKLLVNTNYHFNVPYDFDGFTFREPYHTLAAGIGFTW